MSNDKTIHLGISFKSLKDVDLHKLVHEAEQTAISFFHIDFFDGIMVNSYNLPEKEVLVLRALTKLTLEAHLMEITPRRMEFYRDLGINRVLIHHESYGCKEKLILEAKKCGMEAGIALKPSSPHDDINIIYPDISDLILVMATKSGSRGEIYDEQSPERVRQIARLYKGPIEVNSGVITYPDKPLQEGSTYKLARAGATRFSLEKGLLDFEVPMAEMVRLNLEAAKAKFE